jgi:hypothetical protein
VRSAGFVNALGSTLQARDRIPGTPLSDTRCNKAAHPVVI